jgi:hypothetical protein
MGDLKEVVKKAILEIDDRNVFWCNPFSRMHCNVWLVRYSVKQNLQNVIIYVMCN